ncbi:hypothetical protein [Sutcliffiella rhizosphaerae]|uniref:Uncharacterized protein n=1 Tax=Sutcliffiella rhizosphaerae TaxID=2880967 RepID=A0ABM8YS61_9BACI|nr:hypothetical protein [Sutcliffiella rhizosphaerae]CAG9622796.1 hypothetical protein BACCIP111883_03587 [Sutcliffiella rhizosphaerae]
MASKLIIYSRAKKEVARLNQYIALVDEYTSNTLEQWIIKEYAITNSLVEVARRANENGFKTNGGVEIDRDYVVCVIDSKPRSGDELHRLVRSGYRAKSRAIKNRYL